MFAENGICSGKCCLPHVAKTVGKKARLGQVTLFVLTKGTHAVKEEGFQRADFSDLIPGSALQKP